jgi:hypothetical protein
VFSYEFLLEVECVDAIAQWPGIDSLILASVMSLGFEGGTNLAHVLRDAVLVAGQIVHLEAVEAKLAHHFAIRTLHGPMPLTAAQANRSF